MESDEERATGDAPDVIGETLKRELAHERKKNEELLTRLKYMQADLENNRKRMEKEMKEASESLAGTLAAKLLTVQDEMELAVGHAKKERPGTEIIEGLAMVKKNLEAALESVGVQRIDAVGMPFDPSLHEAVEKVQGKDEGRDLVIEEVRPGYTFRGHLLRPSMVKVELGWKAAEEEARANE